jgi:hypothetical protein
MLQKVIQSASHSFYFIAIAKDLIVNRVLKGITYVITSAGVYMATCDTTKYKSLFIRIELYWTEVTPDNYLLLSNSIAYPTLCVIAIASSSDDNWLLGDAYLRNFFSIHDQSGNRLGLAPA